MQDMSFKNQFELDDYIKVNYVKALGAGREGACFLLPNDIVIKKLYDEYVKEYVLRFKNIDNPSFVFPKNVCMIDGYVKAYFMEYARGESLFDNIINEVKIDKLVSDLKVLVNNVRELSKLGIETYDVVGKNIIYDGNIFKIIDTLRYSWLSNRDEFNSNIRMIMQTVYESIIRGIPKDYRVHINMDMRTDMYLLTHPDEVIYDLKDQASEAFDEDIHTLGDIKLLLKK